MDRLRVLSAIALCLLFCQPAASYADAVSRAAPAVVNIYANRLVS